MGYESVVFAFILANVSLRQTFSGLIYGMMTFVLLATKGVRVSTTTRSACGSRLTIAMLEIQRATR